MGTAIAEAVLLLIGVVLVGWAYASYRLGRKVAKGALTLAIFFALPLALLIAQQWHLATLDKRHTGQALAELSEVLQKNRSSAEQSCMSLQPVSVNEQVAQGHGLRLPSDFGKRDDELTKAFEVKSRFCASKMPALGPFERLYERVPAKRCPSIPLPPIHWSSDLYTRQAAFDYLEIPDSTFGLIGKRGVVVGLSSGPFQDRGELTFAKLHESTARYQLGLIDRVADNNPEVFNVHRTLVVSEKTTGKELVRGESIMAYVKGANNDVGWQTCTRKNPALTNDAMAPVEELLEALKEEFNSKPSSMIPAQ